MPDTSQTHVTQPKTHVILSEAKDPRIVSMERTGSKIGNRQGPRISLLSLRLRLQLSLQSLISSLNPRRLLTSATICLLAVIMLGAAPSSDPSARFGRIGHNMMCVCGCGQVLLECNHVGCPDSSRMIGELREQLAGPNGTGADSLILNWFVGKYGATVLAAPIRGGFDNVAWAIPVAMFLLATIGTAFLVKTWSQKRHTVAIPGGATIPVDDALRDRIRRETEF